MKDKVFAALERHHMISQGDRVLVGLSGGADSVALLRVLLELAPQLEISVSACHVNHLLRDEESFRDEGFCRILCNKLGVELTVKRVDVAGWRREHSGCSPEEAARLLRYEALREAAAGGKIATAHTLTDSAETVLLNLTRGAALEGLCGIPPVNQDVIRPLTDMTREEVEGYLAGLEQDYVTDSSNLSDDYMRNRIRRHVLPQLRRLNPSVERAIGRMTAALSKDSAYLSESADRIFCRIGYSENGRRYCRRAPLLEQPDALRMRILTAAINSFLPKGRSLYLDMRRRCLADELLQKGKGSVQLAKDVILHCDEEKLWCSVSCKPPSIESASIDVSGTAGALKVEDKTLVFRRLSQQEIKFFVNNRPEQFKNAVDCAKIEWILGVRGRQEGDSIRLFGRGCTKTLKKLMNEAGIPVEQRGSVVVLSSGKQPVWVEGFGVGETAALDASTEQAILFEIIREKEQ